MIMTATLQSTITALLQPGKGILAADESFPTIEKRFKALGIPSTEDNRRDYREMLFSTPGLSEFISGVILFDETLRQAAKNGERFADMLTGQGIVPGIKVDGGTGPLPNFEGEKWTLGLDGLSERLNHYHEAGARFTKWRAVIAIGPQLPSLACIKTNARALALFAALSQNAGLVPIVEPEVLVDGDHSLARCEEVTHQVLTEVFAALAEHRVVLEHMVLKSSMMLPGTTCAEQASADDIATATLRCFHQAVPNKLAGIVFLSGGQSETAATERLNAICRAEQQPWPLTYSFGRALQDSAMAAWKGSSANVEVGQRALLLRAKSNSLATRALYTPNLEA